MLDAPCSATGTLRRHPEMVWHRTKQDIERLADIQKRLLTRAASWLAPGGKIVYGVCSLQPEEGEAQSDTFLRHHPQFVPNTEITSTSAFLPFRTSNGALRIRPGLGESVPEMDGFYAICLQRLK